MEWNSNGAKITIVATLNFDNRTELRYRRFRAAFRPRTRTEIEGLSENPPTLH